jgi:hypothetical protein
MFEKWATGFSGCDGGNLRGPIWFCGIEWGTGEDLDLETELRSSVSSPPQRYRCPEDLFRDPVSGRPYPFDAKLLKLIGAMRGDRVAEYKRVAYERPFPFHKDSKYFKLNLFPIPFRKVDPGLWTDKYKLLTGLPTRAAYLQWCRERRFPGIREWTELGQPRLVVGIGRSCTSDFRAAFGFTGPETRVTIADRELIWMSNGKAALAIIPFLGYQKGSLNSDNLLQAFGEHLGTILHRFGDS